MKRATITFASGKTAELTLDDVAVSELAQALTSQVPSHTVALNETTVKYLNMRQVESLEVETLPDPSQFDSEEPVSDSETEPDERTVAQLKEALDGAKVEYPSDARKADLLELAKTNGV